jgi:hypothetical protein
MAISVNIRELRDELYRLLRQVSGVGAVGVAWTPSGEQCLRVSVEAGFAQPDKIPPTFHGVPVIVQTAEVGKLQARLDTADLEV